MTEHSLRDLLGRPVRGRDDQHLGRLVDVIVRLRGHDHPLVTGIVIDIGGRPLFVATVEVAGWEDAALTLRTDRLDLREFARRDGEVLLREDILGHRLIDIPAAALVTAWDLDLGPSGDGLVLRGVDVRPRAWWRRALARLWPGHRPVTDDGVRWRDWKAFEALIGHEPSVLARSPLSRLRTLKAPQLADLVEDASTDERAELLEAVHADPTLEADVFSELDDHDQSRVLRHRTDQQVADVLTRMRADDAADALMDLPQGRRRPVLDLMPVGTRTKVTMLLGYHPTSAGGLMTLDHLALPATATVAEALDGVRTSTTAQPEALATVHVLDAGGRLCGTASLVRLLQVDPTAVLAEVAEPGPIRTDPGADLPEIAARMADHNLLTLPVVDDDDHVLGVITVDDALEVLVPAHWRRGGAASGHDDAGHDPDHDPGHDPGLDARRDTS